MCKGKSHTVQKEGGSSVAGLYVHEAESSVARLDKLFPNWQHEDMAEERLWPLDAAQSEGSDTQAVEEAEDDIRESDAAKCHDEVWNDRRRYLQGGQQRPWMVSTL